MEEAKKKITIVALHLGYGGIEQYLSSLCKMLGDDYDIEIISTYKVLDKPAFNFSSKIKITYLIDRRPNKEELKKAISSKKIISIIREFLISLSILYKKKHLNIKAIKNIKSDYIITTRDFHNNLVGRYANKNIIKIATEHNYHNNDEKYIKNIIKSVKKMDYFILVSEILNNFYKDKVNPRCVFIPNVIDNLPNKFSKANNHTIISVGRLSKEKGQLDLIDVIKLVKEKISDIKLYLIGDGEEKNRILNYIKLNNLEKNVIMTGFLSKEEIEKKMLDSTVFVTTSFTESFGLVVIEACSYKLPVVSFDTATGVKSLLENGNGILIENRDKKKMSDAIIELLNNDKERNKVAEQGFINCQKYLLKNVKKDWLKLLQEGEK